MKKIIEADVQNLMKNFAEVVRYNRALCNLTQAKLSEMVGITEVYLRCIEYAKCTPNWIVWLKICKALKIDVWQILCSLKLENED